MIKSMIYAPSAAQNINIQVAKIEILEDDINPIAATTTYDTTISIITMILSPYIIRGIAENANVSTISQIQNRLSASFMALSFWRIEQQPVIIGEIFIQAINMMQLRIGNIPFIESIQPFIFCFMPFN